MIQIASGLLKGVQLRSPQAPGTRPSGERLRQALFNVLRNFRWGGSTILDAAAVIDLFAGTGAWGIEAASNGAGSVAFVESSKPVLRVLKHNLEIAARCFEKQGLELPGMSVVKQDVVAAYAALPLARVIFCDPPYEKGWLERILELEARHHRIEAGGLLLFEAAAREKGPEKPSDEPDPSRASDLPARARLRAYDRKNYGDSAVHFFVKSRT
ncbi:MAG: RsmD family RNA methyltransferase [Deltaproteobacteria bacterium]|nr:RsmD family RNA methyltransferase [Deltaproteobacteria bacterium]